MAYVKKTNEEKMEEMKAITEKLEKGVSDIFESGKFQDWLNTISKFHTYSLNNQILIMVQRPTCHMVAGYKKWEKDFDRHVKRGEKAIRILGPKVKTVKEEVEDEDGNITEETKKIIRGYMMLSVFGDDQTEGKDLPTLATDLKGNVDGFSSLKRKLEIASPCAISYSEINSSARGFFSPENHEIVIKSGMSEMQTIKTLIHEIAHSMLHCKGGEQEEVSRNVKELQAEAVAYSVCQYLGIDSSDYSFGYIAGWSKGKSTKELKENLEVIRKTATEFINKVA